MAFLYVQGEDCLYLNIWKADEASAEKKPVMVFDGLDSLTIVFMISLEYS